MTEHVITYPPTDVPKQVDEDIWIVDSGPIRVAGLHLPVRMTVIRLGDGGLLLHSPTRFSAALLKSLQDIGPIQHLLAPSMAHWQFIADWQRACPKATIWAAPGLAQRRQVRSSPLRIDRELAPGLAQPWGDAVEVTYVPGGAGFCEAALFHRPSRTLILTDLIINLEASKLPLVERTGARLVGSLAPRGKAPLHLRLVVGMRRAEAKKAARRLLNLAPDKVVFAHGAWFQRNGTPRLRSAFGWLLG